MTVDSSGTGGEAGYRALFDRAADAVLVADDSGTYVDVNPAAARMFGVDRDRLIGRRIADFVVEDTDEVELHWSTFVASDGESGRVRIRRGDGRLIVCDYNATASFVPGRHLSIMRDVTGSLAAQEERERSEVRFRRMLDALELFALVTDTDGRVTFMNQAMLTRLGIDLDRIVGRRLALSQPDGEHQHAALLAAIAAEQLTPDWESEIVLGDGSTCLVRWSSAFVRDERGRVEAVASIGEDVTIRRELEAQVRHAVRMESVGRLASGVAHDFNNFLTVVSGHVELLAHAPELDQVSRAHLDQITRGIDRAARLTRQLLAYGRQQVMEPCAVPVGEALQRLGAMLAPTLGALVTIEIVIEAESDVVFIDPSQLDHVLVNLAVNARDAMSGGGLLRFEVTTTELDETDAVLLGVEAGRYVTLRVTDTGDGIPPALLAHVFEPFVTTKPVGQGTGLGLATAYGIITQSGGAITVDSEPGRGATFTIHLPMSGPVDAGEDATTDAPAATTTSVPPSGTVVVVEDDDQLRSLIDVVLRRGGYDVESFESPLDALEAISQQAPMLVITDVVMKDLDGFELARQVWGSMPDVPVLFMSGHNADTAMKVGSEHRIESIDLLAKPFTIAELLGRVAAAIERG